MSDKVPVVLPFFRASVVLPALPNSPWDQTLDDNTFLEVVRTCPAPFKHNLQRVLVASHIAHELNADIVLAEGWHSNRIQPEDDLICGAETGARMLQLLQDRNLTKFAGNVHRLDASYCTWQEIQAVHNAFPGQRIIGVTSSPCPSATRAQRYLRIQTNTTDVRTTCPLDGRAKALFLATETPTGIYTETMNWMVHAASEIVRFFWRTDRPIEMRLAQAIRR